MLRPHILAENVSLTGDQLSAASRSTSSNDHILNHMAMHNYEREICEFLRACKYVRLVIHLLRKSTLSAKISILKFIIQILLYTI